MKTNELAPAFRAHPWHGVPRNLKTPECVWAYIEMVPTDLVKYELDKATGLLRVDRPLKYSNAPPSLYGFVPRSYCAEEVATRCMSRNNRSAIEGDKDPLDICVLTEKTFGHGDILVEAIPIGGLRLIDTKEVDDKIIAVLKNDAVFGGFTEISQLSKTSLDRLRHYFLTYKQAPDATVPQTEIAEIYDAQEARTVILASQRDYDVHYRST